jgi:hypothetical protein
MSLQRLGVLGVKIQSLLARPLGGARVPSPNTLEEATARRVDLTQKLDLLMAKSASTRSLENEQRFVDARLDLRGHAYRELFGSWRIDNHEMDQLFKTLRRHQTNLMEIRHQRARNGVAGLARATADLGAERTRSRTEFIELLGRERADALARLEFRMNASDRLKAQHWAASQSKGE